MTTQKPSVSTEASTGTMWLFFSSIVRGFGYYYTLYESEKHTAFLAIVLAALLREMVNLHFHRMKIARIRLGLDEGESEWSTSVTFYGVGTLAYVVAVGLGASAIGQDQEVPTLSHLLAVVWCLLDLASYVYIQRFQIKANDMYGNDIGV